MEFRAYNSKGVDTNREKCNMGFDSDTFTKKKKLKTAEKFKLDKNKVKSKMGFRAYNSKGVDKNGAKCNMGFGRIIKIYLALVACAIREETAVTPPMLRGMDRSRPSASCQGAQWVEFGPRHHAPGPFS